MAQDDYDIDQRYLDKEEDLQKDIESITDIKYDYKSDASKDLEEILTGKSTLTDLSMGLSIVEPLNPKSKYNLNIKAYTDKKISRSSITSQTTGKRWTQLKRWYCLFCHNSSGASMVLEGSSESRSFQAPNRTPTQYGLVISANKLPNNGSGYDALIHMEDITTYTAANFTSGVAPNPALWDTGDHLHLVYGRHEFSGATSAGGHYIVKVKLTYASGHIEEFEDVSPVKFSSTLLDLDMSTLRSNASEIETYDCSSGIATEQFYSHETSLLMSSSGHSSGANIISNDYFIYTGFQDSSSFNSGTAHQGSFIKKYSAGVDFYWQNSNTSHQDPLAHEYGINGIIGTPLSSYASKQIISRIDILAIFNNTTYGHDSINGVTYADMVASNNWNTLSSGTLTNIWSGYGVNTYSTSLQTYSQAAATYNWAKVGILGNTTPQLFTFTTLYSENITACTITSTNYTVCNSIGNPSHYEDTEKDCSSSTIPTADLPGGINFANVSYTHDQACCTVCTLIVTSTNYDSDYNANNGAIAWNTLSAGSPSGDTWSTGSMYTAVVTKANGSAVVTGTNAPAGGATVSIATTVNDTSGTANRFTVSSNAQIVPGMKIQSGHTFYDAVSGGSAVTAYVGPVYAGNLNNNATEFYLEDELGNAVYSQSDATPTLVFITGFQGQWGALVPNDASNPYYTLRITDELGCYVETNHVINELAAPTGCTNSTAVNYSSSAVIDDGSCILCDAVDGLLHDPNGSTSTDLFDSFVANATSATWSSGYGGSTVHNSDGTLSVSASIIAAVAGYLDYHSTEKIEFLLYKTVNQGEATTAAGATQIGGTINAGTLDNIGTTASNSFTGLAYGFYTIRVRYVDTDDTKTLENCWSEFYGVVEAEVCDDAANASYMTQPSLLALRDAQNSLLCQSTYACCSIQSFNKDSVTCGSCSPIIAAEITCDPQRTVVVEWEFSTNASTWTSLGTYVLGVVSNTTITTYDTPTGQSSPCASSFFSTNGTGWYKIILTATHQSTGQICTVEDQQLFTLPRSGCQDPLAHNYDPTAPPCPAPCIYPSWDCNNGTCIDPGDGSGTYNCDDPTDPACCNLITCPPPPIHGCTDPCAVNYDSSAAVDDGSCEYRSCLDPSATNYLYSCDCGKTVASATINDQACCILPCSTQNTVVTNTTSSTSTCTVFNNDGAVSVTVTINTVATNWTWEIWDSSNSTLIYADTTGGTSSTGVYTGSGTSDTYSLLGLGTYNVKVTDSLGCSKIEYFTIGSTSPKVGCTDPAADNYDATAVCDCCCIVCGCMDPNALNYNPNANTPCQCDYDIGDEQPNPCIPQDLEDRKLKISGCLVEKGSDWLSQYKIGTNVDCSTMDKWKLIFINYLLDQHNLECLFNCADVQTANINSLKNCEELWAIGGPSTGLNHDPNHAAASVQNTGEGTTVTGYDDFPNGWFGRDTGLNPSNNFTFVGDYVKWDLPIASPFAAQLNGTIWQLTTIPGNPQGAHFGCFPNGKIGHYTQCLDYTKISVTTTTNYYDKFINFANKFCKDCDISLI